VFIAGCLQLFEIETVVRISAENLATVIASDDHMLGLAGNRESGKAGDVIPPGIRDGPE